MSVPADQVDADHATTVPAPEEATCYACGQAMPGEAGEALEVRSPAPACPYCGEDIARIGRDCPHCERDLRPLRRTAEMADRYFNRAVRAARRSDWSAAGEHLAVTIALVPDDLDALVLLGKVRVRQGDPTAALRLWTGVLDHDPDRSDADAALEKVLASGRTATAGRAGRPGPGRRKKGRPRPK